MSDTIATDRLFSEQQIRLLERLVGLMIPASGDFPGAADAAIFGRTLQRLGAHHQPVVNGLAELEDRAEQRGAAFAGLDEAGRSALIAELKASRSVFVALLESAVVSSYYQDERVLQALGIPARPPHPGGYDVAATDWSLLDPVREREPFYRNP